MSGNFQKTPFTDSMNRFAEGKAAAAIQLLGRELPCSVVSVNGAIVTVKFEIQSGVLTIPNVTVPLFGPEYIRYPIQPGDKGVVSSADAYLGGMSGLGGGTAELDQPPSNLSALWFMPIGNINWTKVDPQAVVIYGPNGVVIRDSASKSVITLTPSEVTITTPAATINAPVTINGTLTVSGLTTIRNNLSVTGSMIGGAGTADQVNLQTHRHGTTGSTASSTVAPTPGT
jgi:phage baseplate assembly protein gpV